VIYNTLGEYLPKLESLELYLSEGFKEVAMMYGTTEMSYRKAAKLINRIRYQASATKARTLQEQTEKEGQKIAKELSKQSNEILRKYEEMPKANIEIKKEQEQAKDKVEENLKQIKQEYKLTDEEMEEIKSNPVEYEERKESVEIAIDDVGVKSQKESRLKEENKIEEKGRKYHQTTVAVIKNETLSYVISGAGQIEVLEMVIAFLIVNNLYGREKIFFVDAHRALHSNLAGSFSNQKIQIILDWYHLEKKSSEYLSLAIKGKEQRNQILQSLMTLLWQGRVSSAINFLNSLTQDCIKNLSYIESLITYLERNRPNLPSYLLRQKLGLRNSSSIVEKHNDLLVASRQKHNGMSWSKDGSSALASLTTLKLNNQVDPWFNSNFFSFKLAA